jgi:hypothetical protein
VNYATRGINDLCSCLEDDENKQKAWCFGYMPHPDKSFKYCWFNYDEVNKLTDKCRCPGILVLDRRLTHD